MNVATTIRTLLVAAWAAGLLAATSPTVFWVPLDKVDRSAGAAVSFVFWAG